MRSVRQLDLSELLWLLKIISEVCCMLPEIFSIVGVNPSISSHCKHPEKPCKPFAPCCNILSHEPHMGPAGHLGSAHHVSNHVETITAQNGPLQLEHMQMCPLPSLDHSILSNFAEPIFAINSSAKIADPPIGDSISQDGSNTVLSSNESLPTGIPESSIEQAPTAADALHVEADPNASSATSDANFTPESPEDTQEPNQHASYTEPESESATAETDPAPSADPTQRAHPRVHAWSRHMPGKDPSGWPPLKAVIFDPKLQGRWQPESSDPANPLRNTVMMSRARSRGHFVSTDLVCLLTCKAEKVCARRP